MLEKLEDDAKTVVAAFRNKVRFQNWQTVRAVIARNGKNGMATGPTTGQQNKSDIWHKHCISASVGNVPTKHDLVVLWCMTLPHLADVVYHRVDSMLLKAKKCVCGVQHSNERVSCQLVAKKLQCLYSCQVWLLHAQAAYSMIESADLTRYQAAGLVEELLAAGETMNLAGLYTEFSLHSFFKSNYDEAFKCSMQAINELTEQCSPRVIVETLSQASKACIVKREFVKARVLVTQAVYLARDVYGPSHPKFADTLLDYGFYLLNSDCVKQSVAVYEEALALKKVLYGQYNLHVAVAQEDLAYALYVHEYSSGMFRLARLVSCRLCS
ncbi:Amyloid protein-binding protein 2 [Homalodisca vitripennis]|nr:Amyloid protein-binding protein 2 [Homalodisca vitripennis]